MSDVRYGHPSGMSDVPMFYIIFCIAEFQRLIFPSGLHFCVGRFSSCAQIFLTPLQSSLIRPSPPCYVGRGFSRGGQHHHASRGHDGVDRRQDWSRSAEMVLIFIKEFPVTTAHSYRSCVTGSIHGWSLSHFT